MMTFISYYTLGGLIWLVFMESYTTTHKIGPAWTNKERLTQLLIWPFSLALFLFHLFKSL